MTVTHVLRCLGCEMKHPASVRNLNCTRCGGLFRVEYNAKPSTKAPRVPMGLRTKRISLGEGATPVLSLPGLAQTIGLRSLWAKLEFMAPTGSFKDRGSAILVSAALADGVTEFVEDSSGNAGASLAAYAAAAGMKAHIFVPTSASKGKLDQIRVFGAELHVVDGPRQSATDAALRYVEQTGLPYLSHNHSPFFAEGMKAVAYEINASGAANVSHVVLPVGNGSLLIGMRKGFEEMAASGVKCRPPALHAVQSDSVFPVIARLNGKEWNPVTALSTRASGIAVSRPPRLEEMIDAITTSGGSGTTVTEDAILSWQRRLAQETGIFCEPTSSSALAGLEALVAGGAIPRDSDVLVPITGSGLKEAL